MKSPYDPEKIRQLVKLEELAPVKDKTVYRFAGGLNRGEMMTFLYMPNDRILILGLCPAKRLPKVLTFADANTRIGPQVLAEIRSVEKAMLWSAGEITPKEVGLLNVLTALGPPGLKTLIGPFTGLKGVAVSAEFGQNAQAKVKVRNRMTFGSEAEAQQMVIVFKDAWEKKLRSGLSGLKALARLPLTMTQLIDEATTSLTITARAPQVILALELSEEPFGTSLQQIVFLKMMVWEPTPAPAMQPPPAGPAVRPQQVPS